jgi:hypothetical protein
MLVKRKAWSDRTLMRPLNASYGMFDPDILGIVIDRNIPAKLEPKIKLLAPDPCNLPNSTLVSRDSIRECCENIQRTFGEFSEVEQFDLVAFATAFTHELRHFHDMVGTKFGFHYNLRRMQFDAKLCELLRAVTTDGKLKIPFQAWQNRPDCPSIIIDYMREKRHEMYAEQAMFSVDTIPGEHYNVPGLIINKPMPFIPEDIKWSVPVVNFGFDHLKAMGIANRYYPLNELAVLEGSAFNCQILQIWDLFGESAAGLFEKQYNREVFSDDFWVYFMVPLLMGTISYKYAIKLNEKVRHILYDFALMGPFKNGAFSATDYPGRRLAAFLHFLFYRNKKKIHSQDDVLMVLDEFKRNEFDEPNTERITTDWLADIEKACIVMGMNGGYTGTQRLLQWFPRVAMLRFAMICRDFIRMRVKQPHLFNDPWNYLQSLEKMPMPTSLFFRKSCKQYILTEENSFEFTTANSPQQFCELPRSQFWTLHFIIRSILKDIVYNEAVTCGLKMRHLSCPLANAHCGQMQNGSFSPSGHCIFDSAIQILGLEKCEIQSVSRALR